MLLNVKSIAVSAAVISFFAVSMVGWSAKLAPFTCCKRSLIAAVAAYIITALAAKAINAILTDAIINSRTNQQKEKQNNRGN